MFVQLKQLIVLVLEFVFLKFVILLLFVLVELVMLFKLE